MEFNAITIRQNNRRYQIRRRKNFKVTRKNVNLKDLFILPIMSNAPAYHEDSSPSINLKVAAKKAKQEVEPNTENNYVMSFFKGKSSKSVNSHLQTARLISIISKIIEKGYDVAYEEAPNKVVKRFMHPYKKMTLEELRLEKRRLMALRQSSAKNLLSS